MSQIFGNLSPSPVARSLACLAFVALIGCGGDEFYAGNSRLISLMNRHEGMANPSDKYVVRSDDGDCFYLEDIRSSVSKWHLTRSNAERMIALDRQLRERNIRLIIVPVPTKAEVYYEKLAGRFRGDICGAKNILLKGLNDAGVNCLDLRKTFYSLRKTTALYLRCDTHWSRWGIAACAQVLADTLRAWGMGGTETFTSRDTVLNNYTGDLRGKFFPQSRDVESVNVSMVCDTSGQPITEPLRADVLLFGDSFAGLFSSSAAHLGAHVSMRLGTRVKTVYTLAGFDEGPEEIVQVVDREGAAYKVVVWVFTTRSLMEKSTAPMAGHAGDRPG